MKRGIWSLCLIVLVCLTGVSFAQAQTYDVGVNPYIAGVLREPVNAYDKPVSVDDALIDIGRAANVDIIADVTDVSPGVKVQPFPATRVAIGAKWDNSLGNVIADLQEQGKLSYLRYRNRTFLFWHEPNTLQLAKDIAATGQLQSIPEVNSLRQPLYDLASEYAQKNRNWSGEEPFVLEAPFSQLSTGLQDKLESYRLGHNAFRKFKVEEWLEDGTWERARLTLKRYKGSYVGGANPQAMYNVIAVNSVDEKNQPIDSNMFFLAE